MTRTVLDVRGQEAQVVTIGWLQRWALRVVGGSFLAGLLIAWRLSAQNSAIQHRLDGADSVAVALHELRHEVVLLHAELQVVHERTDSVIIILNDRERRR